MLNYFIHSRRGLIRARSSCIGAHLDDFSLTLRKLGYCYLIGERCIMYAVHFGLWLTNEKIALETIDDVTLSMFIEHLSICKCSGYRAGPHIAAHSRIIVFIRYLRHTGLISISTSPTIPKLVIEFCEWMQNHRGLTDETIRQYKRVARLLVECLGVDASLYEPFALRAAVQNVIGKNGIGTSRLVSKVARGFLRYLTIVGKCRPGLDAAILPVAKWSLDSLPKYVTADIIQQIIDSTDMSHPCGVRDRSILLLLARLGLRGGDIVQMRLSDINWEDGYVTVLGKGRRETKLPMPQEVGDAIVAHLQNRNPKLVSDRIFLRARAPWKPLAGSGCVSTIVRRAIKRAGVSTPSHGAHLLRHSIATELIREGITFPSIGVLLRHRSVDSTAIYAKVDIEMLRSVAQPWQGGTHVDHNN